MVDKVDAVPRTVTVTDNRNGKQVVLPVLESTTGHAVIDIRELPRELGYFSHDPGYLSTSSCASKITYIDGKAGILCHRGYPIEQLAKHSGYLEVCYLLLNGELPNGTQWSEFNATIRNHTMVHEGIRRMITNYPANAHPMGMLVGIIGGGMSIYYHNDIDIYDASYRYLTAIRMIAKLPSIAASCYKHLIGQPSLYPINSLTYTENFLHMMFAVPAQSYEADPTAVKALELLMILHADHEQNASTSTVRLAGSSGANPYACIAAGITTLWGPAHGGANEAVVKMLREIGHPKNIPQFIHRAKDRNDSFRLMGFGHRVYKNFDPRATIIQAACRDLLRSLNASNQPLFDIALELERIALKDAYFIERSLYPNVDFYSGIILSALNIPLNMFTVIFAMSRIVGWAAQWMESMSDPNQRIGRPQQLYTGATRRDYVPLDGR